MRNKSFIVRVACFMLLIYAALFVGGCGGGKNETVYPLSSQTRLLQPGDSWTYDDHEKITMVSSLLDDKPTLTRITGGDGTGEGGYSVAYLSQNENKEVIYIGKKGIDHTGYLPDDPAREVQKLPAPQAVLFGNWAQRAKLSYTLRYTSDAPYSPAGEDATLTIVGTEKINTPLGTFDTWKVEAEPNNLTYNFQVKGTYWYAPQLGVYVRAHEVITGFEIYGNVTRTLIKTNVPLAP